MRGGQRERGAAGLARQREPVKAEMTCTPPWPARARLHEQAYRDLGFQLVQAPAGPLADRVALIRQTVGQLRRAGGQAGRDPHR
jgi:hypothetical protein